MRKLLALLLCLCLTLSCVSFAAAEEKVGSAKGFASDVTVTAVIEDGKVTSLEVDDSGESYTLAGIARENSVEKLIAAIPTRKKRGVQDV